MAIKDIGNWDEMGDVVLSKDSEYIHTSHLYPGPDVCKHGHDNTPPPHTVSVYTVGGRAAVWCGDCLRDWLALVLPGLAADLEGE